MNKQTSINIDFLRLFLCVIVIGSHILDFLKIENIFNERIDFYAVWLFFLLSGYVNWESINKNSHGFFKRRLKRLLPKYYIALTISYFIWLGWGNSGQETNFIFSFYMIQHIGFIQAPETNMSLWSLSYEFAFYGALSLLFYKRMVGVGVIGLLVIFGLLNKYVLILGAGFLIGAMINKLNIEIDFIKLKEIKISKYTYEIYIFHYPILFLIFL